ncbi:hypothetical protein [Lentzea sp. NPDC003310]|uniref:hypothetical protein n=1 Tax=Lentzea sp. NPDC003310 TaxID=3154447 RepID=UPI0033B8AEA8
MEIGSPGDWMFDLIAEDDVVRDQALTRHRELAARRCGVWHWSDGERTTLWYVDRFEYAQEPAEKLECWRHVALYLRWETRFPDEWRHSDVCSAWTRKGALLTHLGKHGAPPEARREAADLLLDVLHRPYRCKDWMFARLVRHVDCRDRLAGLADADDLTVRLRARFLLDLADRPGLNITRKTWPAWLDRGCLPAQQ